MQTFYLDLISGDATLAVITQASSMEDAIRQFSAFNAGLYQANLKPFELERISRKATRGVKYGEW